MSGNIAEPTEQATLTKEVMDYFKVDEKTATKIIDFSVTIAQKKMEKWKHARRRKQ